MRRNSRYDATKAMTSNSPIGAAQSGLTRGAAEAHRPAVAHSAAVTQERFSAVYGLLNAAIAERAFPGCAFGAVCGGDVVLQEALGSFTYEEQSPRVTPQTIFDVASLTKVLATTATAMLLNQRGSLDLETPVAELLPGLVVGRPPGTSARHVKVRHLLAHTSGLPGYVEFFRNCSTAGDLFRACLQLPFEALPGERAEYSDPGFILLGKALEMVMHEPLSNWVRREIFHRLELSGTGFNPARYLASTIAPTEQDDVLRHRIIQGEVQDENGWVLNGVAGHAGLFSNVPDLLRFASEVLCALRQGSGTNAESSGLFEARTVTRFAERQGPEGSSRALGWDTPSADSSAGRFFSSASIGHLGYSGCSLWIDLEAGVAIVLLTNRTWPDRKSQGIRQLRPAFHDTIRKALNGCEDTTFDTAR